MKSALVCAILLVQGLVVMAQMEAFAPLPSASAPTDFRFQEITSGTKAEQLAQYSSQLEQLKLLQERESATQAALQNQMASLNAQAAAAVQPAAPAEAIPAIPEAFSFKENLAAEASTHMTAGAETGAASSDQKLKKLATAMTAVKEDIMAKLREAQRESAWVKDVENIVKQYKLKVKNVKKNLKKIRNDIKSLIKKKRQIRNAQIQSQLQDRLEDASGDLKMIKGKLESISAQQKAFEKNRKKIALTISKINSEMKHLRGISAAPKKKEAPKKKAEKKPEKKDAKKEKDDKKKKDDKKEKKDEQASFFDAAEEEASAEEADGSATEESASDE